jgi:hypothetical protein
MTDILACLILNSAEHLELVRLNFVWFTLEQISVALRDYLSTVVSKIVSVPILFTILSTMEDYMRHSSQSQSMKISENKEPASEMYSVITLEMLEPIAKLLDHSNEELRIKVVQVLTLGEPSPSSSFKFLVPEKEKKATRLLGIPQSIVLDFFYRHAVSRSQWVFITRNLSHSIVRAMLAYVRDHHHLEELSMIPAVPNEKELKDEEALMGVDLDRVIAVLEGIRDHLAAPKMSSENSGEQTISRLYKPRSVLRFQSIERSATTDEFRAILEGKQVVERPVSIANEWNMNNEVRYWS